jgi:hypothetical protein
VLIKSNNHAKIRTKKANLDTKAEITRAHNGRG